jgi:hypothetical protein
MEKTIKLQGVDYKLKSSLFSIISYKNVFGTELFSDIAVIDKLKDNTSLDDYSKVIDVIFKITYILYKPSTNKSYDEFLQDFDFSILSENNELENLASVIAELLGTINNKGNTISKK